MDFRTVATPISEWSGDTLAIGLFEGAATVTGSLAELDEKLSGAIKETIDETEFDGSTDSSVFTRIANSPIRKILLLGLGKADELTLEGVRQAAASIAKQARQNKCKTLGVSFPACADNAEAPVQAIVEGMELAVFQDNRFKSEKNDKEVALAQVDLLDLAATTAAIDRAQQICSGVRLARELVGAPANKITPVTMAEVAEEMAAELSLDIEILEKEACEQQGMGAFLGVAQASDLPPKFLHLTYKPAGTPRRKLAIVGKGLTFDSGGLNLKTSGSGIECMKMDMAGAATTLGTAKAIAQLKPDVEVHFISAVTENMISGRAMHPGDILTASNGKTIEVNNTDAEGRLTLADALVFAEKLKVDAIVDLATLTGACVTALGDDIAGLWSNDAHLAAS